MSFLPKSFPKCGKAQIIHLVLRERGDNCLRRLPDPSGRFSLILYRYINTDGLSSLQIMQPEFHPSSHNQGSANTAAGSKEALSIYGLFHHLACTPQGKQRLRQCFLRPATDSKIINERLDFISILLRPENMDALTLVIRSLKGIKNLRPVVVNLRKGALGLGKTGGISSGIWSTLRSVSTVYD